MLGAQPLVIENNIFQNAKKAISSYLTLRIIVQLIFYFTYNIDMENSFTQYRDFVSY